MKIATWNVNSIKARLPHLLAWLKDAKPDVVMLQELKGVEEAFPFMEIEELGYNAAVSGQKTYNGVALLSKFPIDVLETRLPGDESDEQARYIEGFTGGIRCASIYLPNGNPVDTEKFSYKLAWMERLFNHAQDLLASEDPVVLGGDYNVIQQAGDCHDPDGWRNDALFRDESRAALRKILNLGFTDAYRAFNHETGRYSWWDYRGGGWNKDQGVLIDHLFFSPQAADMLTASDIDRAPRSWEKASDHTPVWCELNTD